MMDDCRDKPSFGGFPWQTNDVVSTNLRGRYASKAGGLQLLYRYLSLHFDLKLLNSYTRFAYVGLCRTP
jgi:hypothetical protein